MGEPVEVDNSVVAQLAVHSYDIIKKQLHSQFARHSSIGGADRAHTSDLLINVNVDLHQLAVVQNVHIRQFYRHFCDAHNTWFAHCVVVDL